MDYWVRKLIPHTPKFVIKNIINYFIGNYLLNELNENQIEVIDNYAQCTNIDLNIKVLNDNFEKQNIPLNVLYGFIGRVRIYLPGCTVDGKLLLEIKDLEISLGPISRATSPDPDIVFGTMVDGMLNMERSFHDENLSNLIFEEKQKGKNFNALISKWISKVCLTLHDTRISFESRPISQINRCCRFLCEIDTLEFGTRDIDSNNMSSSALLGILLTNNIELSGFVLRWEVASPKCDGPISMSSESNSSNEILYGCQLLTILKPMQVNYTLLLNNSEPEFEINFNIDTVHVLLSPLPFHWIQVLASQIAMVDYDPSISKNVKMTESQFDSFFANEDRHINSSKGQANESSIYYDFDTTLDDNSSMHGTTYDDVSLDNSDDDDQFCEFEKDTATCASMRSNVTLFDDDGKMNSNFKACVFIKNVGIKVLLRNPSNDTDNWDNPDDVLYRTSDHTHWEYTSKQFFGLLKTVNRSIDCYEDLLQFHIKSGDIDYFSVYVENLTGSVTNKRFNDTFHRSLSLSADSGQLSETVFNNSKEGCTMQIISVIPMENLYENKAISLKGDYNSMKNEISLKIGVGRCYIGLDISLQDRVRPLLQNNIIEYSLSDKTNSYELNKTPDAGISIGCIAVVNIANLCLEIHVPLVNLNDAIFSKCYWQYRQLHQETLQISIVDGRWLCRIPASGNHDNNSYSPFMVIELYSPSIIASLATSKNNCIEILNIINDTKDSSVIIKIKSKLEQHIDYSEPDYSMKNPDDYIFPYCNFKTSKKNPSKPYSTKIKNNSKNHSTTKVIHTPENDEKIKQYIKKSINNSYFDMEIVASTILMVVEDKEVLKVLYDRLMFDMVLWEPCFDKRTNDVIINYKSKEASETDDDANTDTSFDDDCHLSQRKTKNKFQSKKFTCKVLSNCFRCYLPSSNCENSESILVFNGFEVFTDSDIGQGLVESQSMLIAEIERCRMFHSDNKIIDTNYNKLRNEDPMLNDSYACVLDHVPGHILDCTVSNHSSKMLVLIMESEISKLRRASRPSNRGKQKATTIVTANLNEVCLRVNYVNEYVSGFEWLVSIADMFSLNNPVITGYTFPDSDMTIYIHSNYCAIDLCFSQLSMSVFTLLNKVQLEINLNSTESYCLNSEIGFSGSQVFIRSNDAISMANYFKSDNVHWLSSSLLDEGFVCVADLGSLDLRFIRIGSTNCTDKISTCSLEITNSETTMHLCADSLSLIVTCLKQLMLTRSDINQELSAGINNTSPLFNHDSGRRSEAVPIMNDKQKTELNNMMTDAMRENKLSLKNRKCNSEEYCDDFLLVDDIFSNMHDRVVNLENSTSHKLSVVMDHFKTVASEDKYTKTNRAIFKDPAGYPTIDNSLVIHDFTLSIYFYAGYDLDDTNESKRSASSNSRTDTKLSTSLPVTFQRFSTDNTPKITITHNDYDAYFGDSKTTVNRGGTNRRSREAYQLKFSKINFRYALFSNTDWQTTCISRRLVFIINTVEIICHNSNSSINKVLFCDTNAVAWYDPKSPMVRMRMIFTQSDPNHDVVNEECDIAVSIQPIRLNVDQEIVLFSEKFYQDLNAKETVTNKNIDTKTQRTHSTTTLSESPHHDKDSIIIPPSIGNNKELSLGRGGGIDSIAGSSPLSRSSTVRRPAFDEMRSKNDSGEKQQPVNTSRSLSSVFIRHFKLYPDISVKLDYTGTRLDFTQGAIKGIFYIMMQLNNVVLVIKNKQYLEGITGLDVLITILIKDISEEFYAQLKSIFSKVGLMSEVTEILTGIYDFFTLPYIHYQNEGGIIEGIKLGTRSITTTSLWAALTLLSKGLKIFQKMAETTYDLVSPADFTHLEESYHAARDIREGVTNAAHGVRRRFNNTATDFRHACVRNDRAIVGRIGDVIRQVPPVLASPIVATCEATNQLVDGLRYQLKPEMKIEDEKKWKQ